MTISIRKILANGDILALNREQGVTVQASKENSLDPWKLIPRDVWDSLPDAPDEPVPDYTKIETEFHDIYCWMGPAPIRLLSLRIGGSDQRAARLNTTEASALVEDIQNKLDWMKRNGG